MRKRNASSKGITCSRGHTFAGEPPCPLCWPGYRTFRVRSKVWIYSGENPWYFVTLPLSTAKTLHTRFGKQGAVCGMIPVRAALGSTEWKTSIFRDKKSNSYLLPINKRIRKDEGVVAGKAITVTLQVLL